MFLAAVIAVSITAFALLTLMATIYKTVENGLRFPKSVKSKTARRPIPRKSRFKRYDQYGKHYKLEPESEIIRKAHECRAIQIAAQNPVELQFARILRQLAIDFHYQVIMYRMTWDGRIANYCVPDFVIDKVIYEIDGKGAHDGQKPYDAERDGWLKSKGYTVHRIPAADVFRRRQDVLELVKKQLRL